jgi:hypothetical protein
MTKRKKHHFLVRFCLTRSFALQTPHYLVYLAAASHGFVNIMEYLVEKGAEVNATTSVRATLLSVQSASLTSATGRKLHGSSSGN